MYKIYKITNLTTNEGYVGYSKYASDRIREHMNHCKRNGSDLLRTAIKLFGEEHFTAVIIDEAKTKKEALRKKKKYIDKFRTAMPQGYNQKTGTKHGLVGSSNRSAKLSEAQVLAILKDKRKQKDIAKSYGISEATVSKIKRGKMWKYLNQ